MGLVFLVAALALTSSSVHADAGAGPYAIDLDKLSACDETGSLDIKLDVDLVEKEDGSKAYEGNVTLPFYMDDVDLITVITVYKLSSSGGWGLFYNVSTHHIRYYASKNYTNLYNIVFGSLGTADKPMGAGTFEVKDFWFENLKLEKFPALQYGSYKVLFNFYKDDIAYGCVQFNVIVKEIKGRRRNKLSAFG